VKLETDINSLENVICEYFDNNFEPLLSGLKDNAFPGTYLQRDYDKTVTGLQDLAEYHMSIIAEYWIPTGKARLLGNHPGLGFQVGGKHRNFMADFTMIVRFIESKNPYSIYDNDSLYTTDNFTGAYSAPKKHRSSGRGGNRV
jgi:hypothetical protein